MAIESPEETQLKDYMCMRASNKEKPVLVDSDIQPIIDPNIQIDGNIVFIDCNPYPYDMSKANRGLTCYLNGVMVTNEKGNLPLESISSKPTASQMFADIKSSPVNVPPLPGSPPVVTAKYQMTEKANGSSRDDFKSQGWTDVQLIEQGYMLPPVGVTPSFG